MTAKGLELLDNYNAARQAIFDHVGYVENYVVLPIDDRRPYYWNLFSEGPGEVRFAKDKAKVFDGDDKDGYSDQIYTQRFLKKWVYRGPELTMVVVDTQTDGNRFLAIYDNAKEVQGVLDDPDVLD